MYNFRYWEWNELHPESKDKSFRRFIVSNYPNDDFKYVSYMINYTSSLKVSRNSQFLKLIDYLIHNITHIVDYQLYINIKMKVLEIIAFKLILSKNLLEIFNPAFIKFYIFILCFIILNLSDRSIAFLLPL